MQTDSAAWMNGGSFATAGNIHFAYSNTANKAYVDLNGGVLTCSNTLYAAYRGGNDVTVRLNPNGMFRCNAYSATAAGSTTRFYGNGGTFRPLCRTAAAQTMAANVFTYLYASTNGLVVDTSETLNGAPFTMEQAIRAMSPEYLICDELGGDDTEAIRECVRSGVAVIATVHARDADELKARKALRELLETGAFEKAAFLAGREQVGRVRECVGTGDVLAA